VKGPRTKQEKVIWDRLRDRKKECDLAIAHCEELLREEPDCPERDVILSEIEFEKELKRKISAVIPD
jgi:hypothetical protein